MTTPAQPSSTEYSLPFPGRVEKIDTANTPDALPSFEWDPEWDDDGLDYTYWP